MKIAYLILVHRNPHLLARAIRTLSADEECGFFVHVDRKADITPFRPIESGRVALVERLPVHWGEFSQVEATLRVMQAALASPQRYDYLSFSQGSDYPLRDGRYIRGFLARNAGAEFIDMVRMPAPGYPMSKINTLRYPSDRPLLRFATRALAKLGLAGRDYRRHLVGLDAYAGTASWTLSRAACEYVIDFERSHPQVTSYFRNAFTADEMFFHTILGNSPFRQRVRKNLTFTDWPASGNHPLPLDVRHVAMFEAREEVIVENEWGSGEMLFARKLSDETLHLVDRIDSMIRTKNDRVQAMSHERTASDNLCTGYR